MCCTLRCINHYEFSVCHPFELLSRNPCDALSTPKTLFDNKIKLQLHLVTILQTTYLCRLDDGLL